MAWAVWLAVPAGVTLLAALWTWARTRPPRAPSTARAMREHSEYLDALGSTARPPVRGRGARPVSRPDA